MTRRTRVSSALVLAVGLASSPALVAQSKEGPRGRVSFTAQSFTARNQSGELPGFNELVLSATMTSPTRDLGGTEYRFDFRGAGYPGPTDRTRRISIYDAWVGQRFAGGTLAVRGGQMWVNDVGGLGSLAGGLVEVIRPKIGGLRQLRIGVFGGLEPNILEPGYAKRVVKAGGYATLEGNSGWRNTVGFVTIRDAGLTERSVLTTTNFLPFGRRVFIYQAAEYDLRGRTGNRRGGLNYFLTNARVSPNDFIELQADYHRARSIDARGITLDQLNGRPVSSRALEGLLYETAGGRVTVTVVKGLRVYAGYSRDRNNREDRATRRVTMGMWASNLVGTGFDVRVSDARINGPSTNYDSWDASIGRSLGSRFYLSVDYSSSLSVLRQIGGDGFLIESRPRTNRYSMSNLIHVNRWLSLLAILDRTKDGDTEELRWLTSLIYRF